MTPDASTTRQLQLLAEVSRILTGRLQWWLFGGWAIDFHAGRITRDHSDIEIFVRSRDAGLATNLLRAHGFAAPTALHPDEGQPFARDGEEIGSWFVEEIGGRYRLPGRWSGWELPADSFSGPSLSLQDVLATPVSTACLVEMKRGFASQRHGAPLRPRDRADLRLLEELRAAGRT